MRSYPQHNCEHIRNLHYLLMLLFKGSAKQNNEVCKQETDVIEKDQLIY